MECQEGTFRGKSVSDKFSTGSFLQQEFGYWSCSHTEPQIFIFTKIDLTGSNTTTKHLVPFHFLEFKKHKTLVDWEKRNIEAALKSKHSGRLAQRLEPGCVPGVSGGKNTGGGGAGGAGPARWLRLVFATNCYCKHSLLTQGQPALPAPNTTTTQHRIPAEERRGGWAKTSKEQ